MDCNVIKDLIPLYADDCCSKESADIVKAHIENCKSCRAIYESMIAPAELKPVVQKQKKLTRINERKASVLQSVLLFVSFAFITLGVSFEASTGVGLVNGLWAFSLVVPATGFMLSLANWYFVRLYKSKKAFSSCSLLITLGMTLCAFLWSVFHYEVYFEISEIFGSFDMLVDYFEGLVMCFGQGFIITTVFCILSKVLSDKYASLLGKE